MLTALLACCSPAEAETGEEDPDEAAPLPNGSVAEAEAKPVTEIDAEAEAEAPEGPSLTDIQGALRGQ
jgi:hypothetical protein